MYHLSSWVRNGALFQPVTHAAASRGPPKPSVDGKEPQGITGAKSRLNFHIDRADKQQPLTQHSQTAQHWEEALHVGSRDKTQHRALPLLPALNLSFLAIHL